MKTDKKLLKELKAEAIRRGLTLTQALDESMKLWLAANQGDRYDPEFEINDSYFLTHASDINKEYHGKYVIIAKGRLAGAFDSFKYAGAFLKQKGIRKAVMVRPGLDEPAGELEWLGGSLEL